MKLPYEKLRSIDQFISIPSIEYDLPHRLRVPIVDLLQFFRAQLPAQAVPVLIQFAGAQKLHRAFRRLEPFRLAGPNKAVGGVPLSKGHIWTMDVLQNKDGLVISAEFGRIEVSWVCICVQFCHSPAIFQNNGVAHLAERFFVQMRRRSGVRAPKSCNSSWKYHFIVPYSQLCS